jgi:hypothetical protein
MPLQIKTEHITPGATHVFDFDAPITQRMVGITSFLLSFGDKDHHVQTVSVSLSVNQAGSKLSVVANATMTDMSGNNLDLVSSFIKVSALAWTGVDDPDLKLGNVSGITDGGTSVPITIPKIDPNILQAALAGFAFSFGALDHHMDGSTATVGTTLSGNSASVNGTVRMFDHSGHENVTGTVSAGLLANCDPSLGTFVYPTGALQSTDWRTIDVPVPFKNVTALVSGFKVQYGKDSDHHVGDFNVVLSAERIGETTDKGGKVKVMGFAALRDKSSNHQDDSVSNVSGFIVCT